MLLSLPPSLIAFIFLLLDSRYVSASPENVAYYVASGAGATVSQSRSGDNTTYQGMPVSTGTGAAYASSCDNALSSWSQASLSWRYASGQEKTSTIESAVTYESQSGGTTKVTSIITLCDGYRRVVGMTSVSTGTTYTFTNSYTNTITTTVTPEATYSPPPCSIQPSDCAALSSAFSSSLSAAGQLSKGQPLCTVTASSSHSFSSNAAGRTCDNCQIVASTARLMYWPITTVEGSGDLCNKTAETITPSPTGTAPYSFVTEGITITSPSVAISFGYMSRADGCGSTINHTIIPVKPEDVTSVRGFRALFTHHRFNFADLNYHCFNTNSTNYTIPDGQGDDCYQEVPAIAYFGGLNNAAVYDQYVFRTMNQSQSTIWNDYQPQILPPDTMTNEIRSIWGDGCNIHPDGVWDPPIALTPVATVDGVSYGPGVTTSTTSSATATTAASPVFQYGAISPEETGVRGVSSGRQHFTAVPYEQQSSSGGSTVYVQAMSTGADGSNSDASSTTSTECVTIGTNVYTVVTVSSNIALAGADTTLRVDTNAASSFSTELPVSASSDNVVVSVSSTDTPLTSTTSTSTPTITVITQSGQAQTWSRAPGGLWIYSDSSATLFASQGGPAIVTEGVTVSVATTGIVRVGDTTTGTGAAAAATQTGGVGGMSGLLGGQALVMGVGLAGLLVL